MVHEQVSDEYINFALMYTTGQIFSVLPIKHLVNQYGGPTTPHKLETGTKASVSNLSFYSDRALYESQLHMLTQRC